MVGQAEDMRALMEEVLAEGRCLTAKDLAVGGGDLRGLGIHPGPGMGQLLQRLLEEVWDESLPNEREALFRRAREIKEEEG